MSQDTGRSTERSERKELPIERAFPIERVNEIAQKESRAKPWYRPIYTMHKWWARRLGCVFRSISLYTLLDNPKAVNVFEPGNDTSLADFNQNNSDLSQLLEDVDIDDPDSLWELYPNDVRISDKTILDPFMGGGTSLVEASRFGAEVVGNDLNPVAWFVSKKELECGSSSREELQSYFNEVKENIEDELTSYYTTQCPNDDHKADVMYNFWVKELDCVSCGDSVPLFKDYRVAKGRYDNDDKYNILCPSCENVFHVDDWRSKTTCSDCNHQFDPSKGPASGANYTCQSCGQKYSIRDAIEEQNGFDVRYYALEYYCSTCDEQGRSKGDVKGYKKVESYDQDLFEEARQEWENSEKLREYIPDIPIPKGAVTSTDFGGQYDGYDLHSQGYEIWTDMYNERQLLCLSKLLKTIDAIDDQNAKEYLLLAFSDSLMFQNEFSIYNLQRHNIEGIFKSNTFAPQNDFVENNVWGTEYGRGTFSKTWDKLLNGVDFGSSPTERYIENGETKETKQFQKGVGEDGYQLLNSDARSISLDREFDAVITDPPYYDNVIYSELSDYFYVWQRILLGEEYDAFESESTPRAESIVTNPAESKNAKVFEEELKQAFENIKDHLKSDGVLVFTYHHSDSESWGELLEALCDVGFEVTATYPVNADINRVIEDDKSVSFDIVIVARPAGSREPISWNSLRRRIYRTAQRTQQQLEENRELSRGDIGVVEMGECFHEYSKHHGKVMRAGEEMTAKEVVKEIYGVIQQGSDIGVIDVFLDLIETHNATYDDLNKLTRGTDSSPEQMEDMRLYRVENGEFILGTWDDQKRMAYIQRRMNGDDEALNALDKAQFLRYCYEEDKSTKEYLERWNSDDLQELCEGLAEATGDETYRRIFGADSTLEDF